MIVGVRDKQLALRNRQTGRLRELRGREAGSRFAVANERRDLTLRGIDPLDLVVVAVCHEQAAVVVEHIQRMLESSLFADAVHITEREQRLSARQVGRSGDGRNFAFRANRHFANRRAFAVGNVQKLAVAADARRLRVRRFGVRAVQNVFATAAGKHADRIGTEFVRPDQRGLRLQLKL